jgi:hypothetical protein
LTIALLALSFCTVPAESYSLPVYPVKPPESLRAFRKYSGVLKSIDIINLGPAEKIPDEA